MRKSGRVVVAGGGIGGLCAALALQRRGIAAEVYEAAPELRAVGAGITVPRNSLAVLRRLGAADEVIEAGVALERAEIRDAEDGVLQSLDLRRLSGPAEPAVVGIRRSDLQAILAARLAPGTLHLGAACTGFEQEDGGVRVSFGDGREVRADVLVGADGIRSAVRERLFPGAALRYSGQSCYRGLVEMDLPPALARTTWEVWGGAARFGFAPVRPGVVYWFAPFLAPAGLQPGPGRIRAEMASLYASFPGPIPEMVAGVDPERVAVTDLYDLAPIGRWWSGDVCLLGDAAHATTPNLGQGGAQAVEDAWVLADALARHAAPPDALREYQRRRQARALLVVRTSWRLGKLAHLRAPLARRARNLLLRALPASLSARQAAGMLRPPA